MLTLYNPSKNSSMKCSEYHRASEIAKIQFAPALVTSSKILVLEVWLNGTY